MLPLKGCEFKVSRKTCIKFYWNGLEKLIGLTLTIFQTNRLIAIKYDYIYYNNKILMGEIVFKKKGW
ncbi:hypothetical protein TH0013_03000 [Helicobacter pylori]